MFLCCFSYCVTSEKADIAAAEFIGGAQVRCIQVLKVVVKVATRLFIGSVK